MTAEADAANARARVEVTRAGEREAAWVARSLTAVVGERDATISGLEHALAQQEHHAAAVEARVDALSDDLRRLSTDLDGARHDEAVATSQAAALETELAAVRAAAMLGAERLADIEQRVAPAVPDPALVVRLAASAAETARLRGRVAELEHDLAALLAAPPRPDPRTEEALAGAMTEAAEAAQVAALARAEVEMLTAELTRARSDADLRVAAAMAAVPAPAAAPPPPPGNELLKVREAQIRELEERLSALTAARNAELRRLNERIVALERVYLEVARRDDRIAEIEESLKEATETLETVRLDAVALESRLSEAHRELETTQRHREEATALARDLVSARTRIEDLEIEVRRAIAGGEVEQLRALLGAERERNVRLVRRASLDSTPGLEAAVAAAARPLLATIASLEAELAARPEAPAVRDDVALIRGIGPKITAILAVQGITSLRQIAAFTADDVARIGPLLPVYPGRIVADRWVDQARELLGVSGEARAVPS